jgi:Ca-activated chloride channel homolog
MSAALTQFHFLRPYWLLGIPVALLIYAAHAFRDDIRSRWKNVIAPELLDHLIVPRTGGWSIRPIHLVTLGLLLGSISLAGPTWRRETPPFTEDKAPLVIALDLSQTMDAVDLNPTRLERAKLKLHDLLKARSGARTALFVYAGSAHMVVPLASDDKLFDLYLDSLSTSLMPETGKNTRLALQTIQQFLSNESVPGTVLFVTDGVEPSAKAALSDFVKQGKNSVLVLGVGTSRGAPIRTAAGEFLTGPAGNRVFSKVDIAALKALDDLGVSVTTLTLDDSDVQWIERHVQNHLQAALDKNANLRWVDQGYWLVFPIALLAAMWFRKGWTVQWSSGALAIFFLLPSPASPPDHFRFIDLWLTADQQGRYFFQKQDFATAAARFDDPMWKGFALARANDCAAAIDQFAISDSAEAWYNQGNCLAHLNKLKAAVSAYQQALQRRPGWTEAQDNSKLVQSLIPPEPKEEEGDEVAPDFKPDKIEFDKKGKEGKKKMQAMQIDPEKMADIWMRNIQTTPADFLRQRFAIEAGKHAAP